MGDRIGAGRLHPIRPGVYAVGGPWIDREAELMACVLAGGAAAALSHAAATEVWRLGPRADRPIEITIPAGGDRRPRSIRVHRGDLPPGDAVRERGLPLTSPIRTLLDMATRLPRYELETMVNEADRLDLIDPETLLEALADRRGQRGVRPLRALLERQFFRLTDSELERRFLRIVEQADLPPPLTQQHVNGYRVDFYLRDLGLVVETDGLRYHRTPSRQARDARRDQAHAAAGITVLRFPHSQIRYEPESVRQTLAAVVRRLASAA